MVGWIDLGEFLPIHPTFNRLRARQLLHGFHQYLLSHHFFNLLCGQLICGVTQFLMGPVARVYCRCCYEQDKL